jgi:hypothetical protein
MFAFDCEALPIVGEPFRFDVFIPFAVPFDVAFGDGAIVEFVEFVVPQLDCGVVVVAREFWLFCVSGPLPVFLQGAD